jgi:osmotically-inducible protein OsmY
LTVVSTRNHEVSIVFPRFNRLSAAALAAVIVCGGTACAGGPRKTESERLADKDTADRVLATLMSDQTLYARHINVRADGSIVTLDGYIWTPEEMQAAVQDAEQVAGVTKVVNRMEVDRGAVSDSAVTR